MRTKDIKIGGVYVAKVSGQLQKVRITRVNLYAGWDAINIATGRIVHVRSPQRLRGEAASDEQVQRVLELLRQRREAKEVQS